MCSIVGMAFLNGNKIRDNDMVQNVMRRLLLEGKSRGNISTGVCFVAMNQFTVLKKHLGANAFINTPEYDKAEAKYLHLGGAKPPSIIPHPQRPLAVLGHNRWPTQGSPKDNVNNHPIMHGKVVGTHNGCISNDHLLFQQFEKNFKRIGEVDSEIIFALVDYYARKRNTSAGCVTDAIVKASRRLKGGYACALVHMSHPYAVFLFRHSNPCEVMHFTKIGLIIWASSLAFIRTAIQNYDLGPWEMIPVKNNSGIGIDTHSNKINKFDLEVPETAYYSY